MRYIIPLLLLVLVAAFGCSTSDNDDVTNPPTQEEQAAADSIAGYWFQALSDSMAGYTDDLPDPDEVRELNLDDARTGFEEALDNDPNNASAHLGLALVSLIEVNYNEDLWAMVDSLDTVTKDGVELDRYSHELAVNPLRDRLLGHQFRILAEAPLIYVQQVKTVPPNLTVHNLQIIIHNAILPKLSEAITHIGHVEAAGDFTLAIEVDGDVIEIDKGEVFFFDAALRALRAGLRIMTAYSVDIFGPDGTYDWIEDLLDAPRDWYESEVVPGPASGDTLKVTHYYSAAQDSLLIAILQYNLSPGSSFLTLHTDPYSGRTAMQNAALDLGSVLGKLESALDYIRNEDDPQDNDIIQIGMLEDLDGEIGNCTDCPSFAQDWQTVEDVINWLQSVLSGPYTLHEEIEPGVFLDLTVNISALFVTPVADWKTKLPYHAWYDPATWISQEEDWWTSDWDPTGGDYCTWIDDSMECFSNIDWVVWYTFEDFIGDPPVVLLDGPGGSEIDPEQEFPYFPDYTFGGLFPGMDRQDWLDLFETLGN